MARIVGEVLIRRPVEEVFDFVADERAEPTYNRHMLHSEKVTDGPIGVGTQWFSEAPCTAVTGCRRRWPLVDRSSRAWAGRPVWLFSCSPVGDPERSLTQKMGADPVDLPKIRATTGAREHRMFPGRLEPKDLPFLQRTALSVFRGMGMAFPAPAPATSAFRPAAIDALREVSQADRPGPPPRTHPGRPRSAAAGVGGRNEQRGPAYPVSARCPGAGPRPSDLWP